MKRPATPIINHQDEEAFIKFEDALHINRIRIFLNKIDNSSPTFFFVRVPTMTVLAADMLMQRDVWLKQNASGHSKGVTQNRTLEVYTDTDGHYVFSIVNEKRGKETKTQIAIPADIAREIAAAVLLAIVKSREEVERW